MKVIDLCYDYRIGGICATVVTTYEWFLMSQLVQKIILESSVQ